MPGTALVTIGENQWSVEVASTATELIQGLSGLASIPAGTGMLFVLPATEVVTVDTSEMLFPIDIIFIKDDAVLSIASNIEPGYLVDEATAIDMFLEVNAGEADLVEVGDAVETVITQEPGLNWSSTISSFMPLVVFGLTFGVLGGLWSSGSSSNPKGLSNPGGYYWEIRDIDTGEIIQKGKPYSHVGIATSAAKEFQRHRSGEDKENLVVIRTFDNPNMEEWGKTIKPVRQIGMRHGIPTEIGKTPLQEAALDRLWPYGIMEIHSDGDLTVFSQGKKWVVTTEGGVFAEEDILHLGGRMVEIPLSKPGEIEPTGEYRWKVIDTTVGEIHAPAEIYNTRYSAEQAMVEYVKELGREKPSRQEDYEFEVISTPSGEVERVLKKGYISPAGKIEAATEYGPYYHHSIHGEPRRRLVEQYGSWAVGRAESVCPEDDVECVEREASMLLGAYRRGFGA